MGLEKSDSWKDKKAENRSEDIKGCGDRTRFCVPAKHHCPESCGLRAMQSPLGIHRYSGSEASSMDL